MPMTCQTLLHPDNTAVRKLASTFPVGAQAMTIPKNQQMTPSKDRGNSPVKKNRKDTRSTNKYSSSLNESKLSGKYLRGYQQELNFDLHVKGRHRSVVEYLPSTDEAINSIPST